MTVDQALSYITRTAFVLITLVLLADYLRHRHSMRRDALLMFGVFAVAIVAGEIARVTGREHGWLNTLAAVILITQPYLLLRLVGRFRPVARTALWGALLGMGLSAAIVVASPQPLPPASTIPVISYFVLVEGYAALLLLKAARRSTGVLRRRVMLIGQGSAFLAAVILLAGVVAAAPQLRTPVQPLSRVLALFSVTWYYLGFAPPARLRRAWQLIELYRFLRAVAGRAAEERVARILDDLCRAAARATGGIGSIAALPDGPAGALIVRGADVPGQAVGTPLAAEGTIGKAWQERGAAQIDRAAMTPSLRGIAETLEADTALAVPIASGETAWGVLVVFRRGQSLFPEDDLRLLRLLADQSALVLDVGGLLAHERRLSAELHRSSRELEAANKELEAFSYSVSHDLRAPLRAIDGFTRILAEDVLPSRPPEAERYLGLIRDNARQMGELIDDLLTFSRLSRQPLQKRAVRPAAVAQDALRDLRHEQGGRTLEIRVDDLPPCDADPGLLRQVFMNLLSNALKFTRHVDPARIEVGATQRNGTTVYYVRDNGVGFDMRYADKLFGVFQRLHRAEDYEGTGVGLAIVQRILHRHGGDTWAEAEPGRGATFYFTVGGDTNGHARG